MPRIAVLIPCYNEEKTIAKVIEDYRTALPEAEIYVYNNNSKDLTAEVALGAGAIVRDEPRQGKGCVIRSMFREIEADCYIMTDGDDTYPATRAAAMAQLVLEEGVDMVVDMVVGDRLNSTYFTQNDRAFHDSGNRLVRELVNSFFRSDIPDIMSGSRAFGRVFVKTFPVLTDGFEIETEMTIHALDKRMRVRSMSIDYRNRPVDSVSKLRTIPDGIRVIWIIFRLLKNYRPMYLFGLGSLLSLLAAVTLFIPILQEYLQKGLVPRFPTLIVSITFAIIGILSLFTGFIMDNLVQMERRQFELSMNLWKHNGGTENPR